MPLVLRRTPSKKNGNSWGVWESTNDPLEGKFQGRGGQKLKNHPWWGYGYFLEPHISANQFYMLKYNEIPSIQSSE